MHLVQQANVYVAVDLLDTLGAHEFALGVRRSAVAVAAPYHDLGYPAWVSTSNLKLRVVRCFHDMMAASHECVMQKVLGWRISMRTGKA